MPTASPPDTLLGTLSPDEFLDLYWQKKPLLIRDALPGFESPLAPEELAGLALETDVESRLILERSGQHPWELRHGPFEEEDFTTLPETHWTLLVQAVDRLIPEVADLLDHFRFIPSWRIDDVMVSYAPEAGSVGAHIDNYDVFLLQGLGHRRWKIGHTPVEEEAIIPDLDVRILQDFEADEEVVLGPGDMLYLPPRIAHYGVAEDDCMTYSIGFRAPSYEAMISDYMSTVLEHIDPDARYNDPDLSPAEHPGEIDAEALRKVRHMLRGIMSDDAFIDRWFAGFMTAPRRDVYALPLDEPYTPAELAETLRDGATLRRAPAARVAYVTHEDGAHLFANGHEHWLSPDLAYAAPLLSGRERILHDTLLPHLDEPEFVGLLAEFVNAGYLEVETSDDPRRA